MATKTNNSSNDRKSDKANNPETPDMSFETDPEPGPQVPYPTLGPDEGSGHKP